MGELVPFRTRQLEQDERWLKRADLAARFDVTPRTVTRWQQQGLPHMKQGGVVRFPLSECEDWLRDQPDGRTR